MPNARIIKVFIAGEGGVGKTTMVDRFVKGTFNANTIMTIGANFAVKNLKMSSGQEVTLQIWDLGGEDRFKFILPRYIKGSESGVIAFDSTRYSTFRNLDVWLNLIRENVKDIPLFLVGTKADLENGTLDTSAYEEYVKSNQLSGFFLTSSKSGQNIEALFQKLVDLYEARQKQLGKL